MQEYMCIGKITKAQGIKGEVRIQIYSDQPEHLLLLERLYLDEGARSIAVSDARLQGGALVLSVQGISTRNEAEKMRDMLVYIDRAHAAPLPEGRYYVVDLMGLQVEDTQGHQLGTLVDVTQAGGNDVYSVKGDRSFLFPALKRVLADVNIKERRMVLQAEALKEVALYDDED